jgi:two-component system, NtrC family, nitrogen regulation response regulator NtrX
VMDQTEIKILIVDDEKNVRRSLALTLEDAGYKVAVAENAIDGMDRVRNDSFDLLVVDVRIGEISGLQFFQKLRGEGKSMPVLFMSGNASLTEAVETIRLGGADFLEKPFAPERLLLAVARTLKLGALERKLSELIQNQSTTDSRHEMLGQTAAIRALYQIIEKVAPTKSKVLIQGESGSGKELIARAIHRLSAVARGPFIKVNCAAIPAELIESELFGHERGAFTGAHQMKRGLFELANGGTIFLDEIADMSASAQAKVLRVVQSQELTRVGGSQVIRADARIVAATHKDLQQEVREGRFREDLFFRLNVVPIRSIPLRERKEDIPLLMSNFVKECCAENGFAPKEITPQALAALTDYSWPGNVRELRNLAERVVIFAGEKIDLADFPEEFRMDHTSSSEETSPRTTAQAPLTLEQFKKRSEREFLVATLKRVDGNISKAAELLDTERTYLHRKLQEHGIKKSEYF